MGAIPGAPGRRIIVGAEAHRIGLWDQLVASDQLRSRAVPLPSEVATAAPSAARGCPPDSAPRVESSAQQAMARKRRNRRPPAGGEYERASPRFAIDGRPGSQ